VLFGIAKERNGNIDRGEKCVERIGMHCGKQLPSGSAEFYFRWLVGVNQEITSAQTAQRQFEICVFASLRQDFAWIFVTPDAPHSGALWHWSVEELMPLGDCFDGEINSISGLTPAITRRERNVMSGKFVDDIHADSRSGAYRS
jgi:hypothetical protein